MQNHMTGRWLLWLKPLVAMLLLGCWFHCDGAATASVFKWHRGL